MLVCWHRHYDVWTQMHQLCMVDAGPNAPSNSTMPCPMPTRPCSMPPAETRNNVAQDQDASGRKTACIPFKNPHSASLRTFTGHTHIAHRRQDESHDRKTSNQTNHTNGQSKSSCVNNHVMRHPWAPFFPFSRIVSTHAVYRALLIHGVRVATCVEYFSCM